LKQVSEVAIGEEGFRFGVAIGGQILATEKPKFGVAIGTSPLSMKANEQKPDEELKWGTLEGFRALLDLSELTPKQEEECIDLFQVFVERYFDNDSIFPDKPDIPRWRVCNRALDAAGQQIQAEERVEARIAYTQYEKIAYKQNEEVEKEDYQEEESDEEFYLAETRTNEQFIGPATRQAEQMPIESQGAEPIAGMRAEGKQSDFATPQALTTSLEPNDDDRFQRVPVIEMIFELLQAIGSPIPGMYVAPMEERDEYCQRNGVELTTFLKKDAMLTIPQTRNITTGQVMDAMEPTQAEDRTEMRSPNNSQRQEGPMKAEFRKVKGHNGDQWNITIDALAVQGRNDAMNWPKCSFEIIMQGCQIPFPTRVVREST
jgi:hypothetical protein